MRHAHQMVVDDIGKVIGREAVRLDQDHVVKLGIFHRDVPVDIVVERRRSLERDIEADDMRNACLKLLLDLLLRQMQTVLVIAADLLAANLRPERIEPLLRAEAVIRLALFDQLLGIFLIDALSAALGLDIRSDAAVLVRALVIFDAGILQCLVDNVYCTFDEPLLIGVLDAEHKRASRMLCDQIRIKSCAKIADMHSACRTRCKSGFYHSHV